MSEEKVKPQGEVKKGFWGKLIDTLDKKMQQKCDSQPCCGSTQNSSSLFGSKAPVGLRRNDCCGAPPESTMLKREAEEKKCCS